MKIALCLAGKIKHGSYGVNAYRNGYECLFEKVLSKFDVDIFAHSWDTDMEKELVSLYNPKKYIVEPQIDFKDKYEILNPLYNSQSLSCYQNVFSMMYSRKTSINLKSKYELENSFIYDCVILSRFDLTAAAHIMPISFFPELDMNCIYTPIFEQTNAGPKDEWIYSNSTNMNYIGSLYDFLQIYMKDDSEFVKKCKTGWPVSSPDRFSNELSKPSEKRSVSLEIPTITCILNTHLLYKWHLYNVGKWKSEIIKTI